MKSFIFLSLISLIISFKGIDVSKYQGNIDWVKVKNSGVKFAIIRAGYGRETYQKDPFFETNYANAKAAGVPVGVYWYSYASSPSDAFTEADTCIKIISGKQYEWPIYYDIEDSKLLALGKSQVSQIARNICSRKK